MASPVSGSAWVARPDAVLREGLRYVLAGRAWQQMLGAALVSVGIVLGTAGSVIGNLP